MFTQMSVEMFTPMFTFTPMSEESRQIKREFCEINRTSILTLETMNSSKSMNDEMKMPFKCSLAINLMKYISDMFRTIYKIEHCSKYGATVVQKCDEFIDKNYSEELTNVCKCTRNEILHVMADTSIKTKPYYSDNAIKASEIANGIYAEIMSKYNTACKVILLDSAPSAELPAELSTEPLRRSSRITKIPIKLTY